MPYVSGCPGTITTKRPARLTSWVRRAPLRPDRVLRDLDEHGLAVLEQPLDPGCSALDVVRVEGDVAAVQHAVLRRADVDEGGLHAGQHVLDPAEVDVAVDRLVSSVGVAT